MDDEILPTVAEVALVSEEEDHATLPEEGESLRRLVVVLVNLRQPVREAVLLVENRVIIR